MNNYELYCGDACELLKQIKDETIDCIITDPPYEVISGGAQENAYVQRPTGILKKNDGKIFEENNTDISLWIKDCYRVLKQNTHIYIMTNFLNLKHYMSEIEKAGFSLHNLLVWEKNNATPNRWYMKNCEYIIFARKGAAKPINNCGTKTVMKFNNVTNRIHPTEKPIDLLRVLISNSSEENDLILDPFGGSMSTVYAALSCNRKAISFELSKEYFDLGKQRIENFNLNDIELIEKKEKPLTPNQMLILKVLEENPERDFSGKELAEITGLSPRTCSGCITPLCSAKKAKKTNSSSPFRIQLLKT